LNNQPRAVLIRFGDCLFDGEARTLSRAGRRVSLAPKAFELLAALIEARPKALSQAELRDRLWPTTHVAYTSLARVVSEARRALGENSRDPKAIRTVQRFGYAFVAAVAAPPESGSSVFLLVRGRQQIPLREGENTIGRAPTCLVQIDSERVSRCHARIVVLGKRATLEDLDSKNGTFLGGRRIGGPVPLWPGNLIGVGREVLVFRSGPGQGPTRSDTPPAGSLPTS
jgi:DNA-binding winged helix-turn-helix (wHTH) protein